MTDRTRRPPEKRFLALCEVQPDGCRWWIGALKENGYGSFSAGGVGSTVYAHRWAYERWVGPIPDGMTIDHTCHDPAECSDVPCGHRRCTEPTHLALATRGDNTMRGGGFAPSRAAQTHCVNGHEFTPENIVWRTRNGRRTRSCAECKRRLNREWKARRKLRRASA